MPGIEKMHEKPRKKVRKLTKNAEELNKKPSVIRNVAADTERLAENSGNCIRVNRKLKSEYSSRIRKHRTTRKRTAT